MSSLSILPSVRDTKLEGTKLYFSSYLLDLCESWNKRDSEANIAEAKLPLHSSIFQIHVPKYVGEFFFSQL